MTNDLARLHIADVETAEMDGTEGPGCAIDLSSHELLGLRRKILTALYDCAAENIGSEAHWRLTRVLDKVAAQIESAFNEIELDRSTPTRPAKMRETLCIMRYILQHQFPSMETNSTLLRYIDQALGDNPR